MHLYYFGHIVHDLLCKFHADVHDHVCIRVRGATVPGAGRKFRELAWQGQLGFRDFRPGSEIFVGMGNAKMVC